MPPIIKELRGCFPTMGRDCFIAENACIIGEVEMGDNVSVWYGAVIRGDVSKIRIGNRVNIQDGAVLHANYNRSETIIGDDVSIGHNAVVHGCKIGNKVLIGMGAVVMDNAVIPDGCVIAAGAVVTQNKILEPGIYAGVPAKKISPGSEELTNLVGKNAEGYLFYTKEWYQEK